MALRFVVVFTVAIAVYFLLTVSLQPRHPEAFARARPVAAAWVAANQAVQEFVSRPYQRLLATSAAGVLRAIGEPVEQRERTIRGERFSVEVAHGCDAIELSLLFTAAVIAFPASWRHRFAGIGVGLAAIAVANFARIVTLYLIGAHWWRAFDLVHFNLWPFVLVVATLLMFVAWMRWAIHPERPAEAHLSGA